jgi:flagellar biosynthesis GTPase FlhF
MVDRSIEIDRDFRRQVRRAYYLRETDFGTSKEYNDYLEDVEDLIEQLVCEETRPAARARLDQLRNQWAAQTARNQSQHDSERRRREEAIEQERQAQQRAAMERREAEQREKGAAQDRRNALQQEISAGTTTVSEARVELSTTHVCATVAGAPSATVPPEHSASQHQTSSARAVNSTYIPITPVGGYLGATALVQPIDQAAADAVMQRKPQYMQRSLTAAAEAYEADPILLQQVFNAAGYNADVWHKRYRTEALSMQAIYHGVSA